MRTSFIKFYNFLLVTSVCIFSNAADYKQQQLDEKIIYSNSENDLNNIYSDIKDYIGDNTTEVKFLVENQRSWLKNRNSKCNFKAREANSGNYKCLSDFNNLKIKELKKIIFRF